MVLRQDARTSGRGGAVKELFEAMQQTAKVNVLHWGYAQLFLAVARNDTVAHTRRLRFITFRNI